MWQAEHVQALLGARLQAPVELLGMTTRGDQILDRALSKVGGKGLFVKELETALETGAAHLAVHSLKDVPMDMPEGFVLAAVLEREDPRDAWVSARYASPAELPDFAVIGTSSLRRQVKLATRWPKLRIEPLRGNLDTRLRKLDEGQYDGIVLAAAGLKRLGLGDRIRSVFEADEMIPCAGQGALGIELREDCERTHPLLWAAVRSLIDAPAWLTTHAERAVARTLGGSCSMPLAAHARIAADGALELEALLGPIDGAPGRAPVLAAGDAVASTTDAAEALGREVAAKLLANGGHALLAPA